MRHVLLPHRATRRSVSSRVLSTHRPRLPTWSRVQQNRRDLRLSDIILGMLGLALLGALGIMAGASFLRHALAP